MNRAEKRRQRKLDEKTARQTKTIRPDAASMERALDLALIGDLK
jgi:hypothetical protein